MRNQAFLSKGSLVRCCVGRLNVCLFKMFQMFANLCPTPKPAFQNASFQNAGIKDSGSHMVLQDHLIPSGFPSKGPPHRGPNKIIWAMAAFGWGSFSTNELTYVCFVLGIARLLCKMSLIEDGLLSIANANRIE